MNAQKLYELSVRSQKDKTSEWFKFYKASLLKRLEEIAAQGGFEYVVRLGSPFDIILRQSFKRDLITRFLIDEQFNISYKSGNQYLGEKEKVYIINWSNQVESDNEADLS